MPANEKAHPVEVNLLFDQAIVQVANPPAKLIQKTLGLQWRVAGFYGVLYLLF